MKLNAEAQLTKEPGEKNFSCQLHVPELKASVLGVGSNVKAAIKDMESGWADTAETYKQQGKEVPELNISYRFDVGSLFNYYDYLNMAGVSRRLNISPSLMRQYATGARTPGKKKREEIARGIKMLAGQLETVNMM